jgi:hypothetical protein
MFGAGSMRFRTISGGLSSGAGSPRKSEDGPGYDAEAVLNRHR